MVGGIRRGADGGGDTQEECTGLERSEEVHPGSEVMEILMWVLVT